MTQERLGRSPPRRSLVDSGETRYVNRASLRDKYLGHGCRASLAALGDIYVKRDTQLDKNLHQMCKELALNKTFIAKVTHMTSIRDFYIQKFDPLSQQRLQALQERVQTLVASDALARISAKCRGSRAPHRLRQHVAGLDRDGRTPVLSEALVSVPPLAIHCRLAFQLSDSVEHDDTNSFAYKQLEELVNRETLFDVTFSKRELEAARQAATRLNNTSDKQPEPCTIELTIANSGVGGGWRLSRGLLSDATFFAKLDSKNESTDQERDLDETQIPLLQNSQPASTLSSMTPLTITIGDEPPLNDAPTLLLNTQQQQINLPAVEHVYEAEEEINDDTLNSTNRNDDSYSCATEPEQLFYHPQAPTADELSQCVYSTTINPEAQQSVWEPNQNQSVIDTKWVNAKATGDAADESVAVSLDGTNTKCKCVMCYHLFSSTKILKIIWFVWIVDGDASRLKDVSQFQDQDSNWSPNSSKDYLAKTITNETQQSKFQPDPDQSIVYANWSKENKKVKKPPLPPPVEPNVDPNESADAVFNEADETSNCK